MLGASSPVFDSQKPAVLLFKMSLGLNKGCIIAGSRSYYTVYVVLNLTSCRTRTYSTFAEVFPYLQKKLNYIFFQYLHRHTQTTLYVRAESLYAKFNWILFDDLFDIKINHCSSLIENDPYRLICLSVWASVSVTVWERIQGLVLLECVCDLVGESMSLGVNFEVWETQVRPNLTIFIFFLLPVYKDIRSQLQFQGHTCLPATMLMAMITMD